MRINSERARESWEKFLNPAVLRDNLICCSLYITAWEMLCSSIIDKGQTMFWNGFDENGHTYSDDYQKEVLCRHKSKIQASLLWLQELGAVDQADIDTVDRLRTHRNDIAHNLPRYIATCDEQIDVNLIAELCTLVTKIDRWWIRYFELDCNPEFDDLNRDSLPDSEITSGNMIFLQLLFNVAGGDENAGRFFEHLQKVWPDKQPSAAS